MDRQNKQKFTWKQTLLLFVLFLGALAVRLYDLGDAPLDFHPARQLHSAMMARGDYLFEGGSLPGFEQDYIHEATMRGRQEFWVEPPLMEKLVSLIWLWMDSADLRVPRVLSIIFWLLGGWALLRLLRRFCGVSATVAGLCFYLFFPYAVIASRSFQPDPLMVALILWTLESLCVWDDAPGWRSACCTGLLAGLAIFVKQVAVFPLALAMMAFILSRYSLKQTLKNPQIWLMVLLSVLPVLIYNIWGLFFQSFLAQQYQGRFFLSEITSPAFYIRWMRKIEQVFSLPLLIFACMGVGLVREQRIRAALTGYFLGYILYGLVLPHHVGTHDYYQLLLFPMVSLGIGGAFDALWRMALQLEWRRFSCALLAFCLLIVGGWWTLDSLITLRRVDYRQWPTRWAELAPQLDPYVGLQNVLLVTDDDGAAMKYWGLRTPTIWDQTIEHQPQEEASLAIWYACHDHDFLVVTDLPQFYQQTRLQRYLNENASIVSMEADYLIFDLREE